MSSIASVRRSLVRSPDPSNRFWTRLPATPEGIEKRERRSKLIHRTPLKQPLCDGKTPEKNGDSYQSL